MMRRSAIALCLMFGAAGAQSAELDIHPMRKSGAIGAPTFVQVSSRQCTLATVSEAGDAAIDWRCVNDTWVDCKHDKKMDRMVCAYANLIVALRDGTARSLP